MDSTHTHIEHDLFLLMIQLSRIQDPELIKRMFLESVNSLDPDLTIELSDTYPLGTSGVIAIETARRSYGYVRVVQLPDEWSGNRHSLVQNAAAMLALVLENRHNEQLLVGISELLLETFSPGSPEHANIREILQTGRRGRHLVKQILSFNRQTAQEMMPLQIQPIIEKTEKMGIAQEKQTLPTGDEHILLVDDEKPIILMETRILERLGYQVTAFSDSREAMAAFQAAPDSFDLVITDMAMPHMTGAKLAGSMIAVRPDIPIIICTGYSERINEKTAKDIGIRHFLEKPLEMAKLAHAVRDTLDSSMGNNTQQGELT